MEGSRGCGVFPVRSRHRPALARCDGSTLEVASSSELDHPQATAASVRDSAVPLMRFGPLQHSRTTGATFEYPRFASPRYVASPGFLPLLTPCSPAGPAALFHAAGAPGVAPSECFPPAQSRRLSAPAALLAFTPHLRVPRFRGRLPRLTRRLERPPAASSREPMGGPSSGLLSTLESVSPPAALSRPRSP